MFTVVLDKMKKYISGRELKKIRVAARITTSAMAEHLGLKSRKTIDNWENERSSPNINQFLLFCQFCNVHPSLLVRKAVSAKGRSLQGKHKIDATRSSLISGE